MIKRITSFVMATVIMLSMIPQIGFAASSDTEQNKSEILRALNILNDVSVKSVNNKVFFDALSGFFYDEDEKKAITAENFARGMGILDSAVQFDANSVVSIRDALKYSVMALGYKAEVMEGLGWDYLKVARDEKLTNGLSNLDSDLKLSDMICLFYNLLEAEPLQIANIKVGSLSYSKATNETLLSMHRDIYYHEGVVTSNMYTSIYSEIGVDSDEIAIDETVFNVATEYDASLLGKNVQSYIKDDGDNTLCVLYIDEKEEKNVTLTIEAEDIHIVADDFSEILYYNEDEKIKSAKLAGIPKVIYNGVFFSGYTKADLKPDIGAIELINNDNDKEFDIIKVNSYQTMVVDSFNTTDRKLTNLCTFTGSLDSIELGYNEDKMKCVVYKDGNEIKFSQIAVNDVVNIAMSKNTVQGLCTIYVSSQKVKTSIVSLDMEEMLMETNEDSFGISPHLLKYMNASSQALQFGKEYVFYVDNFGKVAFFKTTSSNDYVLFYKIYHSFEDDSYSIRYMTMDGEWKKSKVAEKVKYGMGKDNDRIDDNVLYTYLFQESPQIVKLTENTKGEIKMVVTAKETSAYVEDTFTKTSNSTYYYRSQSDTFGNQLYITKDTKMVVMPDAASSEYSDYYVTDAYGYFAGDSQYTIAAYDIDTFGFTNLISIVNNDDLVSKKMSNNMFLVTGISQALSEDNEICVKITGSGSGLRNISFLTDKADILSGIVKGDIINFMMDRRGMISDVNKVTSLNGTFTPQNASNYHVATTLLRGTISDIDYSGGKIKLNCNAYVSFPMNNTISCMSYNPQTNDCELITINDLMKDDKLLVRVAWSKITEIIRIDN